MFHFVLASFPLLLVLILPDCRFVAFCEADENVWAPLDKTGWIDPTDLNSRKYAKSSNEQAAAAQWQKLVDENHQLRRRISDLEAISASSSSSIAVRTDPTTTTCDRSPIDGSTNKEHVIFKHLLRKLTTKFSTPGAYVADITFSRRVSSLWHEFLSSESTVDATKSLQDAADSVVDLFYQIRRQPSSAYNDNEEIGFLSAAIGVIASYIPLINFCVLVPATALILVQMLRVSRLQLSMWIIFFLFFISIVWTWIHLYRERLAEMQARFARRSATAGGAPDACMPDADVPAWKALKNYVKSFFSFRDDQCVEYFKDTMVDPIWTVTPLEAVAVAVTKFFVRPLEPLGDGISRFWRALLKDLPLSAYFVVLPFIGLSVVFVILAICGYRLQAGFGLISLEPSAPFSLQQQQQTSPPSLTQSTTNQRQTAAIAAETTSDVMQQAVIRENRTCVPTNSRSTFKLYSRRKSFSS